MYGFSLDGLECCVAPSPQGGWCKAWPAHRITPMKNTGKGGRIVRRMLGLPMHGRRPPLGPLARLALIVYLGWLAGVYLMR
jgi:hypothetical protein